MRDFSLIVFCLYIRGLKSKDLRKKKKEEREREKERKKNAAATRQALLLNIYIHIIRKEGKKK